MSTVPRSIHPVAVSPSSGWDIADSTSLYGLSEWGDGYFEINSRGRLAVLPDRQPDRTIDLYEVIRGLDERGITTPVLLRFDGILRDRMNRLRAAFDKAIREHDYQGAYSCVYPIKVNQQKHVCEVVRDEGAKLGFGLEAGSKPELLAVLGLTAEHPDMPVICNGFKDDEFIRTVILATKLGRNITPVVEKFSELELIVRHAEEHGVRPRIGARVKIAQHGAGRWSASSGARSKFGLFFSELLAALRYLESHGMADCLRMVHFHVGSQINDIRTFKAALNELVHVYTELHRLGAGVEAIDVGGGLGVDYDGTRSASDSSINYSLDEYAADIVYRIRNACNDADVPHPDIITESGRAILAYSSVLVFDVLGVSRFDADPGLDAIRASIDAEKEPPQPVLDLIDAFERVRDDVPPAELYHDAVQAREEAISLFGLGYMSLPMRAACEQLFWAIGRQVLASIAADDEDLPEELADLPWWLSDTCFCNLSVFQSMPDTWAIDQVFPICPIHRLDERPTMRAVLGDITCDSDGKVDRFVEEGELRRTLSLHEPREGEAYYLGAFLVGAYQEVLGDLHNMFGDTHAVHVGLDDDGAWSLDEVVEGDTVREVLSYVAFDARDLRRSMRGSVEAALRTGRLTVAEGQALLRFYESGLEGYTYLEE